MSEAQPAKKRGGHAYGRRNLKLSNTAEEGELCIYSGHSLGRFSSHSMRYDSHQACVRCVAAAREGRMSLDIDRLVKKYRQRALKFWSQVDIRSPDECWNWNGCINKRTSQPQFAWRRHGIASSTQHHPQRVAMWFSWGDLGFAGVKTTCGNKYCCNPFHLIPQNVGVFVDDESYIDSFELAIQIQTLKQQVQEYMIEEAMKQQERIDEAAGIDAHNAMMIDTDADFGDRFQAVITDLLGGHHPSLLEPDDPGMYRKPVENEEDDESPHNEF
tara:strand:- start:720 stop:1535 length:816 start_codon:yes stop_codon:yes gene_type:complete